MQEIKIKETEFRQLYQDLTLKQLAEHYKVKINQISKIAKTLNLKKRKGPKSKNNILTLE